MSSEKATAAAGAPALGASIAQVDIEKSAALGAHANDNTAQPGMNLRGFARRLVRTVSVISIAFLGIQAIQFASERAQRHDAVLSGDEWTGEEVLGAYWSGIAQKGFRAAVKGHKHGSHGKDGHHDHHDRHVHHGHHDKHGEHGKHGKHGRHGHDRAPIFIPPKQAEGIFLSVPNNDSVRAASRRYTSHAHIAGSGWDYVSAIQLKGEWEAALGLHVSGPEEHVLESGSAESQARVRDSQDKIGVWVDTYYPYMNTPVESAVTLFTEPPFHAQLKEDIIPGDPDSQLRDEVRAFHGLSANGDVTAQYVYAGYGRKRDYELLEQQGVDLKGKIVLVKYGGVFRGLKIEAAQDAGAIAVLIFTDPGDDGDFTEEHGYTIYPDGPARQPSSIQRGSVQFLSKYPGDPTTPNVPAYRNVTRTPASSVPRIPSLPISYQDAIPLLTALNGKGLKGGDIAADWVGGLGYKGVEYWVGPSEVNLRVKNEVNNRVMPIWNTMATIPGHISDEIVIVGNHRDAWVLGAGDPSSGTASMTELVRGLGALLKKGWRPMRTIILASWDAEEYGLIGSTEFAEDHGDWLANRTAAYLNMDESVTGSRFAAGASPSLAWLLRNAAADVLSSADASRTVLDARHDQGDASRWTSSIPLEKRGGADELYDSVSLHDAQEVEEEVFGHGSGREEKEVSWIRPLGSGSDFTSFLQRFGIASSNIGFSGGKNDAVYHYHSIYDSFTWMEKFADPGFHRHVDAAKVLGLMTLRLADSVALPINTTYYAHELSYYLEVVRQTANATGMQDSLDLGKLSQSIDKLVEASHALDARREKALKELKHLLPKGHGGKHRRHRAKYAIRRALAAVLPSWMRDLFGMEHSAPQSQASASAVTSSAPLPLAQVMDKSGWPEMPAIDESFFALLSESSTSDKYTDSLRVSHTHSSPRGPPPHIPKKKIHQIARVLRELRDINQNVRSFEKGFISENGIKGREWYRHKGVAPGKWLGYGATTFPALTEAITLDKSVELAQKEADELVELITAMAHRLSA